MQNTEEIWKDVVGYEGLYQVSNKGRIKSIKGIDRMGRPVPIKILQTPCRNGYPAVGLYRNGIRQVIDVHRIAVHAFYGVCPKYVDHVNEVKSDNCIDNLDPVTQRENIHRYRSKRRDLPLGVSKTKHPGRVKKYLASIFISGKVINLGFHMTPELASEAFQNKLQTLKHI